MTELTLSTGRPVPLKPAPVKKFRGTRLPGADLRQAIEDTYTVSFHHFTTDLFQISLRNFVSTTDQSFRVTESSEYIRLETVLTGELYIKNPDGSETNLLPGQYRITDERFYEFEIKPSLGCQYFVVYISRALTEQTPMGETIQPSETRMMSDTMREVIHRILDNPFEEKLRDASYDYRIRELLFYHIAAPPFTMPGELTPVEISAVYAADAIIAANLNVHYTIPELARMVQTNVYVLKTGFPKIFGASVLDRLLQRKMDRAKYLLETTDKQIQEISELSGYETPTGFINAFKKIFKISPKDWRKKSRGLL
jgi:AraC-like DNA-binding protein